MHVEGGRALSELRHEDEEVDLIALPARQARALVARQESQWGAEGWLETLRRHRGDVNLNAHDAHLKCALSLLKALKVPRARDPALRQSQLSRWPKRLATHDDRRQTIGKGQLNELDYIVQLRDVVDEQIRLREGSVFAGYILVLRHRQLLNLYLFCLCSSHVSRFGIHFVWSDFVVVRSSS